MPEKIFHLTRRKLLSTIQKTSIASNIEHLQLKRVSINSQIIA